jgi:transposase-like protein
MNNDIDNAQGDEFTEVTVYDPAVKARAYKNYLTGCTISEIALDVGVRVDVVASWATNGDWRKRRMDIEKEMFDQAADNYRALIIKHRAPVIERHLRVAGKLEEAIESVIDDAENEDMNIEKRSALLKRTAEALSAATGVSARAAAITDRAFDMGGTDPMAQGKVPLITLNVMPQLPPEKCVTIDV